MRYVFWSLKGPEVQNCDHLHVYLKKKRKLFKSHLENKLPIRCS